jgi:hypothetical protein
MNAAPTQADRDANRVYKGMWWVILLGTAGTVGALGTLAYFLLHGYWAVAALIALAIVGGRYWFKAYNGVGPR